MRQTPIRVPESQRKDLKALLSLSEDAFDRVVSAVNEARPATSAMRLAERIADPVGIPAYELEGILRAAMSLYATKEHLALGAEDLIDQVVQEAHRHNLLPEDAQAASAKAHDRLAKVLGLEKSLGAAAKARELALEQPNPFEDVRILTDLRPVFTSGDDVEPMAAMVLHTLKLTSHGEEGHKVSFFSFSGGELRDLRAAIDRALKKEVAIVTALNNSGMKVIEVDFD